MYKNLFSPRDIRELNLYGKNCFQTLSLSICAFISCTILVNRRIVLWVYIISIKMSEKDPQYNWTPFLPSPAPLPSFANSLISSYFLWSIDLFMYHLVAPTISWAFFSNSVWIIHLWLRSSLHLLSSTCRLPRGSHQIGLKGLSESTFPEWKPFSSECVTLHCITNPTKWVFLERKLSKLFVLVSNKKI